MPLAPTVTLSNGKEMPILGLGTYKSTDSQAVDLIKHAIDNGYRHIDTALLYQNEAQVGQAIREKIADGTVTRDEIFLVTKLANTYHDVDKVEYGCRLSLRNLGLDYIDLFLMHSPMGLKYLGDRPEDLQPKDAEFSDVDYLDTWREMEKLVAKGLVRSIGVSNFNSEQLQRILDQGNIKPTVNQVEVGPTINQRKLIKFCKDRGVVVTAFTPLGRMKTNSSDGKTKSPVQDPKVTAIGVKYGKSTAQVILRYLIQLGVVPIPKSSNYERVVQNLSVFDFELNDEEMEVLRGFDSGERMVPFTAMAQHKYFMFNIEF